MLCRFLRSLLLEENELKVLPVDLGMYVLMQYQKIAPSESECEVSVFSTKWLNHRNIVAKS